MAEAAVERDAQPQRITELCVEMLGVTGAGISMVTTAGNHGVVCATDEVSGRLEDLQDVVGEGPGRAASESGRIEVCPVGRAADDEVAGLG